VAGKVADKVAVKVVDRRRPGGYPRWPRACDGRDCAVARRAAL